MRTWTDEQLRDAVAQSRNISETLRLLRLRPVGGNYDTIRRHIAALQISTAHWNRPTRYVVDRDALAEAVQATDCVAGAIAAIGWPCTSNTRRRFRALVELYGLDTSHFIGGAAHIARRYPDRTRPVDYYLVLDGPRIRSHELRLKLIDAGMLTPECSACGGTTWQGCPIPLELEHKNGNRYDNRLENLTLLCPNCHALTPTYRGRNIGGYRDFSA